MLKFLLPFILLITSIDAYCQADSVISTNQISKKTNSSDEITIPSPSVLRLGWWRYFNVDNKLLLRRIKLAKQQYTTQLDSLEKPQQEAAQQNIDRFISNLFILNKLKSIAKNRPAVELHPLKGNYSIDEWLDIKNQLRAEKFNFIDNQNHLKSQENVLKVVQNKLSNLQLEYVKTTTDSGEKFLLGLNIMEERTTIAVYTERLKLNKKVLDHQSKHLNNLRKLSKVATTRLQSKPQFSFHLNSLIAELQQQLKQNKKSLRKTLAASMAIVENTPSSISQARMRDQKVTKLMIEAGTLKLEIASKKAEKDLSSLLLSSDTHNLSDIQNHVQQWQDLIASSQKNSLIWYKDSATELTRIQDKVLNQTHITDANKLLSKRSRLAQSSLIQLRELEIERDKLNALSQEVDNRIDQRSGKFAYLFNRSAIQAESYLSSLASWTLQPLFSIGKTPVTTAGVLRALLIIGLAGVISVLFRQGMDRLSEEIDVNGKIISVFYIVRRLLHYVILLLGFIIALSSIGLDFTNLAIVAGALSVGIGFGLQSIVNNFVSGLILLFEGTIKVGDFIELDSSVMGVVREINIRSTQLNTPDNVDIIIPNSVLIGGKVINWTLHEANRRIHVPFGVAYGTDKELVKKAVLEAASRVQFTYKPKHTEAAQCWLVNFGDSSLDFELVVWINRDALKKPPMVKATYLWEIESSLHEYDIEIPFPQRDLHLRSGFGGKQYEQELRQLAINKLPKLN